MAHALSRVGAGGAGDMGHGWWGVKMCRMRTRKGLGDQRPSRQRENRGGGDKAPMRLDVGHKALMATDHYTGWPGDGEAIAQMKWRIIEMSVKSRVRDHQHRKRCGEVCDLSAGAFE